MRLEAVRRIWERLLSAEAGAPDLDGSFTSSELAVERMVQPALTDLKTARHRIEELSARASALGPTLDLLPVPALVLDDKGGYVLANKAARELFGGPALPASVVETAAHALRAGTERNTTSLRGPGGKALRVVPADMLGPRGTEAPEPTVVFLLPAEGMELSVEPLVARYGLSPTQGRVTALVALGLTNKEVAARLGLSSETVKTHLDASFRKTGAETRAGLVALVFGARYGLTLPG
jgi:DNA-binding CsgD family transcriptional regulator